MLQYFHLILLYSQIRQVVLWIISNKICFILLSPHSSVTIWKWGSMNWIFGVLKDSSLPNWKLLHQFIIKTTLQWLSRDVHSSKKVETTKMQYCGLNKSLMNCIFYA